MSLTTLPDVITAHDTERTHRLYLRLAYWAAGLPLAALLIYGFDYYVSSPEARALSPKHAYLKPSGVIGLHLGIVGFFLFLLVYLYPLRKHSKWLSRQGSSRHWLDFHVLLGLVTPLIITFHSSFKFSGIAGVAYWIMVFVALSGLVGRYIYLQIPRSLTYAEMSLKEGQEQSTQLSAQLNGLGIVSTRDLDQLLRLPDLREAERMSLLASLWKMMLFDLTFPARVWRLRQKMIWGHGRRWSWVGFGRTQNERLERAIALAREQAQLSKKVLFLSKSKQLFNLWHVIHLPFSYSFAVLGLVHVALMVMLGYY
jgi:hypothetical protein